MNDNHTLVIPTFNRPQLLGQLVRYYRECAPEQRLLVLDSSESAVADANARALSIHGDVVRHEVFPTSVQVVSKLLRGLMLVQTPYVSFCADDDLLFLRGLRAAIGFLEGRPEYASAHGLYFNFREADRDIFLAREYAGSGIEAGHAGARIFRLCQRYESLFYGVFRTSEARSIFSALPALSTVHFQELFQSIATVIRGKVARIPVFYAARRTGPQAQPGLDKWQTHQWFAENPGEFVEQYQIYRDELLKYYDAQVPEPRLDRQTFFRTLDLAHAAYFSASCPPEYFYSALQPNWPDDAYAPVGALDTRHEAARLLALRRALLPRDGERLDGFEYLRTGTEICGHMNAGVAGGLRYLWQSAWGAARITELNQMVTNKTGVARRCRLPLSLRWLANVPHFRETYLELCRYLGGAGPAIGDRPSEP